MKKEISLDRRQSEVIEFLRFPLIILVVFIHIVPSEQHSITTALTIQNAYVFISELVSHHIGRLAVPAFFLFSGYFFFLKINYWSTKVYFNSWKSRYKTLLIPYVAWNLILVVIIMLKNKLFAALGFPLDDNYHFFVKMSTYDLFWGAPVNYPLWYLRDLIVMTLLTPLFYYFFKTLRIYGVLILLFFYMLIIESGIPGLSTTAIFFFGVGAYFGLFKRNILTLSLKYGKISLCVALITLAAATYYTAATQNEFWIRIFSISATTSLLVVGNKLFSYKFLRKPSLQLSQTVFFIYAIHTIYIINWSKGGIDRILTSNEDYVRLFAYFIAPVLCIIVSLTIYYAIKIFLPQTLNFLTGNRTK